MTTAILTKIGKLLALRDNAGATEAEATLAAEHVQRLLQENGLTMAEVEAAGGSTADAGGQREKRTTDRRAMYAYQRTLMAALAENNFCLHMIVKVGNGTGRELVLTDVYGTEDDLNNDLVNGFSPGTTAARRRTTEAQRAEREAKEQALVASGMDPIVAFYVAYGYGEAEAKTYASDWTKRSCRGGGRGRSQNWTHADEKHHQKINSSAYKAGRAAGDSIGLDTQVGTSKRKLLS